MNFNVLDIINDIFLQFRVEDSTWKWNKSNLFLKVLYTLNRALNTGWWENRCNFKINSIQLIYKEQVCEIRCNSYTYSYPVWLIFLFKKHTTLVKKFIWFVNSCSLANGWNKPKLVNNLNAFNRHSWSVVNYKSLNSDVLPRLGQ